MIIIVIYYNILSIYLLSIIFVYEKTLTNGAFAGINKRIVLRICNYYHLFIIYYFEEEYGYEQNRVGCSNS